MRLSAGLSMDAFAEKVSAHRCDTGIDRRYVMKWEAGDAPLSEELLGSIGTVLGVDSWTMTYLPEPVLPARARLLCFSSDTELNRFDVQHAQALLMNAVRLSVEKRFAALRIRHFYHPVAFKSAADISAKWADDVAATIRRRWALGSAPVADMAQTLEEQHVTVSINESTGRSPVVVAAFLAKWPVVCWWGRSPATTTDRCSFRLRILEATLRTMALSRGLSDEQAEGQSAIVARALLLPHGRILYHFGGRNTVTPENVRALSGRYGLPIAETITRLVETGAVQETVGHALRRATSSTAPFFHAERPLGEYLLPPAS